MLEQKRNSIKRVTKEKVAVLHVCSEREVLNGLISNTDKLSIIITGNGNIKEGIAYQIVEMGSEIKNINEKLTGISGIVKELHEESTSKKAIVKTDKEIKLEKRLIWQKWIQTFMFIIAAFGLILTAYFGFRGNKVSDKIQTKVDDIGIPFVTNSRGEIMALPDSTLIKYFPNDSLKYIIKKEK